MAVLATSSAFFMIILDTSIVNLALPSIGAELASTLVGLQWIVDGTHLYSQACFSAPDRWLIVTAPGASS